MTPPAARTQLRELARLLLKRGTTAFPAFVFVAVSGRLVPILRRSPVAGAALDGVNVAALALMAVVTWQLGRAALVDLPSTALAVVSAVLLLRYRTNSTWLVLSGAVLGLALRAH